MRLYQTTYVPGDERYPSFRTWHRSKRAAAQSAVAYRREFPDTEVNISTVEVEPTRTGILELLNTYATGEG